MRVAFAGRQRGVAALLVVALLVVGVTFLLLRSLNAATWRAERYRVTQEALLSAKEALVARAVADDNRPGSLPCPDTDDDGVAELFTGTACPSYIGRLPWRTLDLPDLRDSTGERLWYALSPTHRDNTAAEPINSNTAGQFNVAGMQPASNVIAVLIAPGSALVRSGAAGIQDRSCVVGTNCNASLTCTTSPATGTPKCNPVNYLDVSSTTDNAAGSTTSTFVSAAESDTFNDRILAIVSDDIMPLVEKRVGREFAQKLRDHYDLWSNASSISAGTRKGFYPWAAPFDNPENETAGENGRTRGLLPLSTTPVVWTSATPSVGSCTGVGTAQIQCTAFLSLSTLSITARVGNIATRFVNPPNGTEVTYSGTIAGTPTSTWSLNAATQSLDFSHSVVLFGLVTVRVNAPSASAWTTGSWLTNNKWNRVTYYGVSAGYGITGDPIPTCGAPAPECATVGNTAAPNDNKHAVVVTTGRALPGQDARPVTPPADIQDYLEGANAVTPADLVFEQNLRTTVFNDQPSVVRP